MEWTDLHGPVLSRAFERVLGRAESGAMAFVRCLTSDVVAALASDRNFDLRGWEVLRVAADRAGRTITADEAVERREGKGSAAVLLVDTDRAGAGMDGIYNAGREVDESGLFEEAMPLASAEVTRRLTREHRRYAERAVKKAQGFRGRYSVSPWTVFDYLCRVAAHRRHPGAYLHLLGLWPVQSADSANPAAELDVSRRFVDHLLGTVATGLTIPARIESLRLAKPTDYQRRDLERFLRGAETRPLLDALSELADNERLWVNALRIDDAGDVQAIDLIPWRNPNGKIAKWSGLVEGSDADRKDDPSPPGLILKPEAEHAGDYSRLEVRWRARPILEMHAVDYRVAVLSDMDEIAAREVRHSARREEKCRFSNDDFSSLDEDTIVSAKVRVSVIGKESVEPQDTEEFVIRFGQLPDPPPAGVGTKVRAFSEGLVDLDARNRVSAVADNLGGAVDAKGFVLLRVADGSRRRSFRVFRPSLIREVEEQWIEGSGAIGWWRVRVRASGERAGAAEFVPFEGGAGAEWDRACAASRKMAERFGVGGGGVGQVHDDKAKGFGAVRNYLLSWIALLEDGDPRLALCNTVEVLSLAGQPIGLIVLPAHPLRVAWRVAYDNLALHAVFEQGQAARDVREELSGLDGAMFPAFLPNPHGGAFVFADTLGFHAVGMVTHDDKEPKAAMALLARALGEGESADAAPTVGGQSAQVLGDEIVKYLDCHDASGLLRLHALRAGDGLTVARALGRVDDHYRRDDDDRDPGDDSAPEAGREPVTTQIFSLELYPSPSQRAVAGRFIAEAGEKRRRGAGVLASGDRWMLESVSLRGEINLPRLRWARKDGGEPNSAAHLAVAFDTFESRIARQRDEGKSPPAGPFRAFGLLSFYEREFESAPLPTWRSAVRPSGEGEKHPSERGHSERLERLQRAVQGAVARHLGAGNGSPVLVTEVSPEKEESLKKLHRLCDWVVTLDRNAGIEYFDSPQDNRAIYDAYVIDCVPEREDLGCLQLITSTANLEEVHDLLDGALDRMGLSRSRRNAEFLLEHLKALSGRLAIRLSGNRPPTAELVALAICHAHCRQAPEGNDCWPSFDRGFVVPVDDVQDLLPPLRAGDSEQGVRTRPDLIHVSVVPRKGLVFRFIEVKYRRHLRTARAPELLRKMEEQTSTLRLSWREWYSHAACSSFRAVRRAKLARVLRFYADKARRHHLPPARHEELVSEIDRMIERGGDYVFPEPEAGDLGWIFCPEYAGIDSQPISPSGWSTRIFLFGPDVLPDSEFHPEPAPDRKEQPAGGFSRSPSHGSGDGNRENGEAAGIGDRAASGGITTGRAGSDASPSIRLGTDLHANADVHWALTVKGNPHLLTAGLPGMGKTTCLLNLCRQMVETGVRPIVFSYHQDIDERLSGLIDAVRFIDFDGLGFNPLRVMQRESATAHLDVAGKLRDVFSAIFPELGDLQCERVRSAIKDSFVEAGWPGSDRAEPKFKRFVEILRSDPKPDRGLKTLLARLGELDDYGFFEVGEARESLWESDRPVVIRIHATQNDTLQRAFAALVFYGLYKDMFRRGIQDRITHALIFDEAHRAAGLKLIPAMAKECRKYGISLVLASQEARDFHPSVFSAIANYLVLRLTETDAKALVRNVATAQQERMLIDRIKQMDRFKALYFCEGKRRPAPVRLRSLD